MLDLLYDSSEEIKKGNLYPPFKALELDEIDFLQMKLAEELRKILPGRPSS